MTEHTSYISGEDRITKVLVQRYYSIRPLSPQSSGYNTIIAPSWLPLNQSPRYSHWSIYPKFNDEGVDIQHQNGFVATYRQNGTE
ncbi:hypothetical protein N5P37_011414 [Trichoderma harzianum]|nr:hypothetical protein N5P37_011414 [Trichoderma harzianum]